MGEVLEAEDLELGRRVALKRSLNPHHPVVRARFLREAQALASLEHPGVVRILDFGEVDGRLFLVMERLEGAPLEDLPLEADPLPPMFQVAEALEALHGAGMLHRDLKPANVFLTREGRAVLLDFGLVLEAERTRLTETGQIVGTPSFMPPELVTRGENRPEGDWYAWGASLYWLLERRMLRTLADLERLAKGADLPDPVWSRTPPEDPRRRLVEAMLAIQPEARPASLVAIRAGLADPDPEPGRTLDPGAGPVGVVEPVPGASPGSSRPVAGLGRAGGDESGARPPVSAALGSPSRPLVHGRGRLAATLPVLGLAGTVWILAGVRAPESRSPGGIPARDAAVSLAERVDAVRGGLPDPGAGLGEPGDPARLAGYLRQAPDLSDLVSALAARPPSVRDPALEAAAGALDELLVDAGFAPLAAVLVEPVDASAHVGVRPGHVAKRHWPAEGASGAFAQAIAAEVRLAAFRERAEASLEARSRGLPGDPRMPELAVGLGLLGSLGLPDRLSRAMATPEGRGEISPWLREPVADLRRMLRFGLAGLTALPVETRDQPALLLASLVVQEDWAFVSEALFLPPEALLGGPGPEDPAGRLVVAVVETSRAEAAREASLEWRESLDRGLSAARAALASAAGAEDPGRAGEAVRERRRWAWRLAARCLLQTGRDAELGDLVRRHLGLLDAREAPEELLRMVTLLEPRWRSTAADPGTREAVARVLALAPEARTRIRSSDRPALERLLASLSAALGYSGSP